jgi:hypothetical protein
MRFSLFLVSLILAAGPNHAARPELDLPGDLITIDDGRASIHRLYALYGSVLEKGWSLDVIAHSRPEGTRHSIPVIALRSARKGPAIWIISGIHGEEPAGPNAIAAVIDDIATLGERHPVVLIPLSNPQGYVRNWRYLNAPIWSDDIEAQSVGDSSHMLPDPGDTGQARAAIASSPEAAAMTRYVFEMMAEYPPLISIDLHEDDKISEGYVYSQGAKGPSEPLAIEAVKVLEENTIPIKLDGYTRFDEKIEAGIIGPVTDSSIDELMSAKEIIVDGVRHSGPAADTVLVFETPAGNLPLSQRTRAHEALLQRIILLVSGAEF